ncbi:hypothetical protein RugamoR57_37290 [Duganella caerulea]|uniref:hypothetical protein n=1 Tax=Duganella caerulea TaxID=2885762 RepID=UPI0030E9F4FF
MNYNTTTAAPSEISYNGLEKFARPATKQPAMLRKNFNICASFVSVGTDVPRYECELADLLYLLAQDDGPDYVRVTTASPGSVVTAYDSRSPALYRARSKTGVKMAVRAIAAQRSGLHVLRTGDELTVEPDGRTVRRIDSPFNEYRAKKEAERLANRAHREAYYNSFLPTALASKK